MARAALWGEMPPTSHRHTGTFKAQSHGHSPVDVQTWMDSLLSQEGLPGDLPAVPPRKQTDRGTRRDLSKATRKSVAGPRWVQQVRRPAV